jgi:predicted acylesterase/phospholipase RssA
MADIRTWGDEGEAASKRFVATEGPKIKARVQEARRRGLKPTSNLLALSGGADDGAFGAGLLVGWGQKGDRPQFDLVTGVSAGALIAPFAFIGAEYDKQLSEIFTNYGGDQIYQANILAGILGGPGLARNDPLKRLIDKYVDRTMARRLAEERAKGRILLIGTTNIDVQRPVFWDIGRIAQTNHQHSVQLIRDVLIASAAIPGVFPPVRIKVKAGGKQFEELHVDGGTTREVFFSPADFTFRDLDKAIGTKVSRSLYVIRNGKLGPEYEATSETVLALGARSLSTVLKNQTIGDLIRMHARAQSEGIDYNLAAIPDTFKVARPAPFDQAYMKALYAEGFRLGREGYAWMKRPPGVLTSASR